MFPYILTKKVFKIYLHNIIRVQDKLYCIESAASEITKYSKRLPPPPLTPALRRPFLSFYIQAEVTVD